MNTAPTPGNSASCGN